MFEKTREVSLTLQFFLACYHLLLNVETLL